MTRPPVQLPIQTCAKSPTWSACRWVAKYAVMSWCGISSAVKFTCEPDPKSMMNLSPLPSSISQEQLACARRTNGRPVPSAMMRISLAASGSVFGK